MNKKMNNYRKNKNKIKKPFFKIYKKKKIKKKASPNLKNKLKLRYKHSKPKKCQ